MIYQLGTFGRANIEFGLQLHAHGFAPPATASTHRAHIDRSGVGQKIAESTPPPGQAARPAARGNLTMVRLLLDLRI